MGGGVVATYPAERAGMSNPAFRDQERDVEEIRDRDLHGATVERVSLREASLIRVRFTNARMRSIDFSGADIRGALLEGTRVRMAEMVDVRIDAELRNVVVNGVDIAPLVEAELNRRDPDRALLRAATPAEFRQAWETLERLWQGTIERARTFDEEMLHRSVDEEWSFIQTLRHLNFANAAWVDRMILGDTSPWHPLDLPWDEAPGWDGIPWDRDARPTLDEVLTVRERRIASVRDVIDDLDDDTVAATVTRTEPGYPQGQDVPVKICLGAVLNEQWEHRRYAERDLDILESEN